MTEGCVVMVMISVCVCFVLPVDGFRLYYLYRICYLCCVYLIFILYFCFNLSVLMLKGNYHHKKVLFFVFLYDSRLEMMNFKKKFRSIA